MAWTYRPAVALDDRQFKHWHELLEQRTGIDYSQHRSILQAGLVRRMREVDCEDYDLYFEQVCARPQGMAEWSALVDCITIGETSFFRQPRAYALVKHYLAQRLQRRGDATLDLWSVGCSTGEEAYSLAMIASDAVQDSAPRCFVGVIGSDISLGALTQARRGHYSERSLARVPEALRQRHIKKLDRGFQVVDALRERVCFTQANLVELQRLPTMAMDVIFCQNVLVYFRRERRLRVLDALVDRLKPGGLLVIGPGEAPKWQNPRVAAQRISGVQAYVRQRVQVPVTARA